MTHLAIDRSPRVGTIQRPHGNPLSDQAIGRPVFCGDVIGVQRELTFTVLHFADRVERIGTIREEHDAFVRRWLAAIEYLEWAEEHGAHDEFCGCPHCFR